METAWAGAAWIEIQHAVLLFDLGLMAVTVDDHAESGGFRLQVELREIMKHVNRNASGFDNFGHGQPLRPGLGVDIAADRGNGRDFRQRLQNFRSTNVAGVENALRSAQSLNRFGPQQSVSV